jgi:DNA-binding NarL/FixJ family response regulator
VARGGPTTGTQLIVSTAPTTVLIADDHALIRAGFRSVLSLEDDIDVVGEASNGADALDLALREAPDIVLMDIRMPVMDGLEVTRRIVADPGLAGTKVVILTTFDLDEYLFGSLRAGASAFLLKGIEPAALVDAVRVAAGGESLLDPGVTRRLIEAFIVAESQSPSSSPSRLPPGLTSRELDVLRLVAGGLSNQEISEQLFISPLTCKSHVSRILYKLGARDRTQLVMLAYESGLVVPGHGNGSHGVAPEN